MELDDILSNPEAENELRNRPNGKEKKKVTEEQYQQYVQDRLLEACGKLDLESIERQYQRAASAVRELNVVPETQDISDFLTRNIVLRPRILGIFASALINTVKELEEPIILEITKGVTLDYFGYKLNRDVIVKGDLGDHTAYMMESKSLVIDGSCNGVVGEFMGQTYAKGPVIDVRGTIRDVGAVRYSGTIRTNRNLGNYYNFKNLQDLLRVIAEANIFQEVAIAIRQGEVIPLEREMKRVLHSQLVAIACNNNLQMYERERSSWQSSLTSVEREYDESLKQWNTIYPKYQKAKKDAIGTGIINGAALLTPFAPIVLFTGMITLFTGMDSLSLGNQIKMLQPRITALEGSMRQYREKLSFYDTKISEVRDFMRI